MTKRLALLLPQTGSRPLRFIVAGLAAACAWCAVQDVRFVLSGEPLYGILIFLVWIPIAIGLWRLSPIARRLALFVLWYMVFGIPFGELSIWTVMNAPEPPGPVWEPLLFRVAPFVIPAALAIELLCAYRSEFRPNSVSELATSPHSRPQMPRSWILWCLAVIGTPAAIVALLSLKLQPKGACVPLLPTANGPYGLFDPLWTLLPVACAAVGLLAFLRAAPAEASRRNRVVRVILYAAAMFLFYGEVTGYIRYERLCGPGPEYSSSATSAK